MVVQCAIGHDDGENFAPYVAMLIMHCGRSDEMSGMQRVFASGTIPNSGLCTYLFFTYLENNILRYTSVTSLVLGTTKPKPTSQVFVGHEHAKSSSRKTSLCILF